MENRPDHTDVLPPPAQADAAKPKRKRTAGELAFDRIVYTGIGFGVNEASSLWITDQFMHGKNLVGKWFSKEGFNEISAGIAKFFKIKDSIDPAGKITPGHAKAGNALLMVTLLSGGTLLILPMKWLEDHKIYWTRQANHFIDRLRGNTLSKEETAARDNEVEQAIACSPKQSWPSMLMGRVIACASSVSAGTFLMGPQNNNKLMNWSEKLLTGSMQPSGQQNAAHRYARLLSVETYSCALSSIVLEITSKLFAKRGTMVHDPELCKAKADAPPAEDSESSHFAAAHPPSKTRKTLPVPAAYCEKIKVQNEQPQIAF